MLAGVSNTLPVVWIYTYAIVILLQKLNTCVNNNEWFGVLYSNYCNLVKKIYAMWCVLLPTGCMGFKLSSTNAYTVQKADKKFTPPTKLVLVISNKHSFWKTTNTKEIVDFTFTFSECEHCLRPAASMVATEESVPILGIITYLIDFKLNIALSAFANFNFLSVGVCLWAIYKQR